MGSFSVFRRLNENVDWLDFTAGSAVTVIVMMLAEMALGSAYLGAAIVMAGLLIHAWGGMALQLVRLQKDE